MSWPRNVLIVVSLVPLVAVPFLITPPRFKHTGTITVDDTPFEPVACKAITGSLAGVDLYDARGARLTLLLTGVSVRVWANVDGTPRVTYAAPGTAPVDIGTCGSLTIRGGGYHGQNKRAVSGHASLSCSGRTPVWANADLDDCF